MSGVSFHDWRTVHGSEPNRSSIERCEYLPVFCAHCTHLKQPQQTDPNTCSAGRFGPRWASDPLVFGAYGCAWRVIERISRGPEVSTCIGWPSKSHVDCVNSNRLRLVLYHLISATASCTQSIPVPNAVNAHNWKMKMMMWVYPISSTIYLFV